MGNSQVGGQLGTPSFVLIKSNFPNSGIAYQTSQFLVQNKAIAQLLSKLYRKIRSEPGRAGY
ncbi:hypothetical protein [Aliterella atlantica]|uniref:Uncharacterized protein n=1 Tax=Aliterella atlantica CENA595 TaxID=1618023 RepID=A0A0D8ZLX5_9CYAN|nr:hypothetical protein [Aliterella atlantica]KJH69439.1 hypothetical protein UH38_23980 [Aliterella atlantica CENA595]